MMLLRPKGLIPERRHKINRGGVQETTYYDVQHERPLPDRDPRMTDNLIEVVKRPPSGSAASWPQ